MSEAKISNFAECDNINFSTCVKDFCIPGKYLKTQQILDASRSVISLMGRFGKAFSPIIYDLDNIISKLNSIYHEDKENFAHFEFMILNSVREGKANVSENVIWLERLLRFWNVYLQMIIDDLAKGKAVVSTDWGELMKTAYTESLEHYHGWLGTQLCNILCRTIPGKSNMIYILTNRNEHSEESLLQDLKKYNQNLKDCVERLTKFIASVNLNEFD